MSPRLRLLLHTFPPPSPKSPPLSLRSSLSEAQACAPTHRLRSQPPVLPTPSSRQPGSQRSAGPRSLCVLRGRRRGEAASSAGEVGAEAQTEARRLRERRRGGRDGAWTAVDPGRARSRQRAARSRRRAPRREARVISGRPCTERPLPQRSSHLAERITPAGPHNPDSRQVPQPWHCLEHWVSCSCTGSCSVPTSFLTTRPSSSREGMMYSSCVRRARRSSWKSWHLWAWPPNHSMSDVYRRL